MHIAASLFLLGFAVAPAAFSQAALEHLTVEHRQTPLGIDVARPRFGWRHSPAAAERGFLQASWRIVVRDPSKTAVWDSGVVRGQESQNILYQGRPLQPVTRYDWTVTAWDHRGRLRSASSWFETGLMDPAPDGPAWSGALWIGGGNEDLVLYSPYLSVFELGFTVAIAPGSTRASFIFGANDPRLVDKYKNIYQLANGKNESYFRLELDISGLDAPSPGKARLHVYRAGYHPSDDPGRPFRTFDIPPDVIHPGNRHEEHRVDVQSVFGAIAIRVNGSAALAAGVQASEPKQPSNRRLPPNGVNLNPAGLGGDYLTYGMLCEIGFAVGPGQEAAFRDVTVRHLRTPRNVLFQEDLSAEPYSGIFAGASGKGGFSVSGGRYRVSGGSTGLFLVRDPSRNSMPMLRTQFPVRNKPVQSARLYATARGIYEMYLNGSRVGTDWYTPGFTQYNRTHLYQTYDITAMLRAGNNALGAMLGEGWWSGLLSFGNIWNHFGDRQSLRAKLVVRYADGSSEVFVTNEKDWKYFGAGPVVYSSQYMGEVYDAAREDLVKGWSEPGFDGSSWKQAREVPLEGSAYLETEAGGGETLLSFPARVARLDYGRLELTGQIDEPAGVFLALRAKSVREVRPGVFVYDLGQNITGVPRITIRDGLPGRKITLRFSEMLYPNLPESGANVGMIMTENYRAALSQDVYVTRAGSQVIQPRFTWHGFQYIEITGIDAPLPLEAVEGLAISSVRKLSADFRSSNEKVNRLWHNIVWSTVDNFLWIPTDCPQRNERMGWSGDLNVFSRTASYITDAAAFFRRHMRAMRDTQSPEGRFPDIAPVGGGFGGVLWGSAGIVVPWESWLQYGDRAVLEEHYPAMAAYMSHLRKSVHPESRLLGDVNLGDWLGFQNRMLGAEFLAEAYYVWCLDIMARTAELLGKTDDAKQYRQDYEERKTFFNTTFVSAGKRTLGIPSRGFGAAGDRAKPEFRLADTQSSYAVGLALNAFSEDNVPHMAKRLAETVERENRGDDGAVRPPYSLMTGFIGTAWISKALSRHGFPEHAYRLLQATHFPSWLYPVEQGATTIWERLNGYTIENGFGGNNSMNSFNHYSFGAVGQWLMAHCLGIERAEPGFRRFVLQPEPDPSGQMTWASGHYESPYGVIRSSWRVEDGWLFYRATVPPNTTATLYLPASSAESVTEGGQDSRSSKGVTLLRYENGKAVYLLVSGDYEFRSRL